MVLNGQENTLYLLTSCSPLIVISKRIFSILNIYRDFEFFKYVCYLTFFEAQPRQSGQWPAYTRQPIGGGSGVPTEIFWQEELWILRPFAGTCRLKTTAQAFYLRTILSATGTGGSSC